MTKNVIKLNPIIEVDEDDNTTTCSSSSSSESTESLRFIRKCPVIYDLDYSQFSNNVKLKSISPPNKGKTIYQVKKENNDHDIKTFNSIYSSKSLKKMSFNPIIEHEIESRAIYLPYSTLDISQDNNSDGYVSASPYKYLGSEQASVLKIFISNPKNTLYNRVYTYFI